MTFTNNNFRGMIDGKDLYYYTSDLNYKIKDTENRIKYIEDRLGSKLMGYKVLDRYNCTYDMKVQTNDKYWEEVFTQTSDVALDKDGLYQIEDGGKIKLVSYSEYISWCELNNKDALESTYVNDPFKAIHYEDIHEEDNIYDDVEIERGEWKYTGVNTSKIKLVLSQSDDIYSTSNVSKGLEKLGSYILNAPVHIKDGKEIPKKENLKYKIYNSRELFNRACQEYNTVNKFLKANGVTDKSEDLEGEAIPIFQPYKQNFNKVKTVKYMGYGDVKKYPILKSYSELYDRLKSELNNSNSKLDKKKLPYLMKGLKDDLNLVKQLAFKPIVFKSPLTPVPKSPYEDVFIPYKNELYAMLQSKVEDLRDLDMMCCHIDLLNIMKKCKFTERQLEILDLWSRDYSVTEIADILDISHPEVNNYFNRMLNKITKKYEEQYEDWIGFNYKKSEWKQCSRCGEVKLIQRFNKEPKGFMGVKPHCKDCN